MTLNKEALIRVFGKPVLPVRLSDAKFPDSDSRLTFIQYFPKEKQGLVHEGLNWILERCNAYTIKQYSLRDAAVQAIQANEIELALDILAEIGKVE